MADARQSGRLHSVRSEWNIEQVRDHHLVDFNALLNTLSCTCLMLLSVLAECGLSGHCESATVPSSQNLDRHLLMTCFDGAL